MHNWQNWMEDNVSDGWITLNYKFKIMGIMHKSQDGIMF